MYKSKESAVFAELLAEVFPAAEERAAHEREVAKLVALAGCPGASGRVTPRSKLSSPDGYLPAPDRRSPPGCVV
jgi:hypothetical protein